MNPRLHEEFAELCAVFYTGELSDEEWALLQIHMAYCDECRRHFEEYKHVATELIPVMAAAAATVAPLPHESSASLTEAERQLFERIDQLDTSPAPKSVVIATAQKLPFLLPPVLLAFAAGIAVVVLFHVWSNRPSKHEIASRQAATPSTPAPLAAAMPASRPLDSGGRTARDAEIASLRQQLSDDAGSFEKATTDASTLRRKLEDEESQRTALLAEKDSIGQQLAATQSNVQQLRTELDSRKDEANQHVQRLAELEGRVRALNISLEEAQTAVQDKERMLALDKDFLSHDRDIRDVIGARNLYIADIFDTTESGKTAKPFGRIFYTQDRSLVFYGFDLEKQGAAKHAVAYQVWGSGTDRNPVSLGLFYQDDGHKRWVLRCNDTKTLSRLNMVFVTVEPTGGSRTPTGQQFLRSYLQIPPNHP